MTASASRSALPLLGSLPLAEAWKDSGAPHVAEVAGLHVACCHAACQCPTPACTTATQNKLIPPSNHKRHATTLAVLVRCWSHVCVWPPSMHGHWTHCTVAYTPCVSRFLTDIELVATPTLDGGGRARYMYWQALKVVSRGLGPQLDCTVDRSDPSLTPCKSIPVAGALRWGLPGPAGLALGVFVKFP